MKTENLKSKIGFRYSMLALIIFISMVALQFFTSNTGSEFVSLLIGIFVLIAGVLAIIGLINSLQGLRDPISMEKIAGLTINGFFAVMFILVIVANVLDIQKALQ